MFLFDYYGEGRDPFVPYLKVNKENAVTLDGIGILKGDKLKLHLNDKETFSFKLLSGHHMNGDIEFLFEKEGKKGHVVLAHLYGDTNMHASNLESIPQVTINLTMNAVIKDYPSWLDLKDDSEIRIVSKQLEKKVEQEVDQLLKKLQDHEVDPVGIGDFIRGKQRDWNEEEFYKTYPYIKFRVETKLNLLQSGIGE
ncbi:Ger(x)C family spore germination C-terminal domain-containing protein [Priestia abyssalis]|uniref:Ger(x)C family spore germination C-terminal domain-containing protein n=1 Tax=Priestia abyssalis TaxID=1221450 RepID=UPI002286FDEB|nr:Ger(x)C family spore germination C-terminal domain-containing protein [Priestia abyssalis]